MEQSIIGMLFSAGHFANVLSRKGEIMVDDGMLIIVSQAHQFLGDAIKGEEIRETGNLCAGASEYLRKLGWAMQAFDRMGKEKIWEARISWLRISQQVLFQLKKGDLIKLETFIEIRDFFHQLELLLLSLESMPTDIVRIQAKTERTVLKGRPIYFSLFLYEPWERGWGGGVVDRGFGFVIM